MPRSLLEPPDSSLFRPDPMAHAPAASRARDARDVVVLLVALLALMAWDASGADLAISRRFGDAAGFAWRDHWLLADVLHTGARRLAWVLGAVLLIGVWRPVLAARRLSTRERARWFGATVACAAAIPLLKQLSATSCPWSLAEFGGTALHVSHWLIGQADGGPGRCFPAGHAAAAFCFLPGWFALRDVAPASARAWLLATLVAGVVLGAVQVVRGAHFASHALWTAWWCWAVCTAAYRPRRLRAQAHARPV